MYICDYYHLKVYCSQCNVVELMTELSTNILILKMACCQLDCKIFTEYGNPWREFTFLIRAEVNNDNTGHKKQENSSRKGTELGSTSLATHT